MSGCGIKLYRKIMDRILEEEMRKSRKQKTRDKKDNIDWKVVTQVIADEIDKDIIKQVLEYENRLKELPQ